VLSSHPGGWHMTSRDNELRSSQYWRGRAEEARIRAGEMRSPSAESSMLDIAAMYERMADRAAEREARSTPADCPRSSR
jgi:hypothetical protein